MKQGLLKTTLLATAGMLLATTTQARFSKSFAAGMAGGMVGAAMAHKLAKKSCHRCHSPRTVYVKHVIHHKSAPRTQARTSSRHHPLKLRRAVGMVVHRTRAAAPRTVVSRTTHTRTVVKKHTPVRRVMRPAVVVKHTIKRMSRRR